MAWNRRCAFGIHDERNINRQCTSLL